ncbi:MAG: amidohydrolase family protein, partial [Blastocatellia bacterium]
VFEDRTLRFLIEIMGDDRVMLGSDYPFPLGENRVSSLIRGVQAPLDVKAKLLGANAELFLGLAKGASASLMDA